ncbi:MAG: 50S ribosomal protein L17 [Bacteroidales bacterium]|nr:50S ribosomal protein L17 [Bacteroidales bacterium]
MRHQRVINHLGRTSSHRKSMISNMAVSLILHKRITTTTAKAKVLKTFVEPLITKSKEDSTHSRRVVFSYLKDKTAVSELFREISPRIAERPGGYTRILKTGNRIGDNAEMCILELVDFNEAMKGGDSTKQKTTRRRRPGKKASDETTATAAKSSAPRTAKSKKAAAKAEEAPEKTSSGDTDPESGDKE